MICSALASRSGAASSVIERRPALGVALVPSTPMNELSLIATSGSACTIWQRPALLARHHLRKRDIGRRFRDADDETRILLREKILWARSKNKNRSEDRLWRA